MDINDYKSADEITWCPGCGDFGILSALKHALADMGKQPHEVLLVSGIGQAAKLPHYIKCNCFNGLHGRSLPAAVGAKLANRELTVIVTTGDGDCYGEGGNHFIHNIRRNADITVIVHNNQVYGLTKGQASPTSERGFKTKVQRGGVLLEPMHPLQLAIVMGCGFAARGYSKDFRQLAALIRAAVEYPGFALIDVLQPCVTFNKKNKWYDPKVYEISTTPGYDPSDTQAALHAAGEWGERIPTGILYKKSTVSYEKEAGLDKLPPLVELSLSPEENGTLLDLFQ